MRTTGCQSQLRAIEKWVYANVCYGVGNMDALQRTARAKRILSNLCYGVGDMDVLQRTTTPKRTITNLCYGVGDMDVCIFRKTRDKSPIR